MGYTAYFMQCFWGGFYYFSIIFHINLISGLFSNSKMDADCFKDQTRTGKEVEKGFSGVFFVCF